MEKGTTFKVLDHGYLKLIDWMGNEASIIEAARMSTGKGFEGWDPHERCKLCGVSKAEYEANPRAHSKHFHEWETRPGDAKLLHTLYTQGHMTPFEMCELLIEIQAPIMVFREHHRHRTWSYNEFSARYAQMPNLHYLPEPSRIQKQSTANKQGSAEAMEVSFALQTVEQLDNEQQEVYETYDSLVNQGVAKEVARLNTPVSRYSKMRAKVNLRNCLAFLLLRKKPSAQYEIRQYADVIGEIVQALWPRTWELFMEHTFNAVRFSASEVTELRGLLSALLPDAPSHRLFKKLGGI